MNFVVSEICQYDLLASVVSLILGHSMAWYFSNLAQFFCIDVNDMHLGVIVMSHIQLSVIFCIPCFFTSAVR